MNAAELKEFKENLAALNEQLQRDIHAHAIGLDASPAAIAARRKRVLQGDFEFFAYTYFPHHIRGTPSKFQKHFFTRFPQLLTQTGGVTEWWIAPRGECKSSLLTKIGPLWSVVLALLQREEIRLEIEWQGAAPYFIDYIILLGAETKLPSKLLEVIKTELTINAALAMDFPEVVGRGSMWRIGEIVTRTNVKIETFGAEQAVRGTFHGASRPKLLLGDDLITDAEAKSPTERENRWQWLDKSISFLGPPDGSVKFLGVGTVLNKDDPISRAKRTIGHVVHHFRALEALPDNMGKWAHCYAIMLNEDGPATATAAENGTVMADSELPSYKFYLSNKTEMDQGAIVSWPEVRSLYVLMRQRAKSRTSFNTEMQGDGRSDEDKVFNKITFWVQRLAHWIMFGACDPSLGKGESSDPSAIMVGGFDPIALKLHVIAAEIKRRVPSKLSADLIAAQREFKCRAWAFENNGAFEHSRQTFINDAIRAGVNLPLIGVTASVAPEVRIDSLEPDITDPFAPRILLHSTLISLLSELDSWPEPQKGHHYDGLVTLHLLRMIAFSRGAGSFEFQSASTSRLHDNGQNQRQRNNDDSDGAGGKFDCF